MFENDRENVFGSLQSNFLELLLFFFCSYLIVTKKRSYGGLMFENDRENVFGTLQSNFLELFVLLAPDSHKNREVIVDYNV